MQVKEVERLSLAITQGSKAYDEWSKLHHLTSYLTTILYDLLLYKQASQKELVQRSDIPKQSINKGIKLLQQQGYLVMKTEKRDKRVKVCELTLKGQKYAQAKMASLFSLEDRVAQKIGSEKMKQLVSLNEEWSQTFWQFLRERSKA